MNLKGLSRRESENIAARHRSAPKRKIKDRIKPLGKAVGNKPSEKVTNRRRL